MIRFHLLFLQILLGGGFLTVSTVAFALGLPPEYYLEMADQALASEQFSQAEDSFDIAHRKSYLDEGQPVVKHLDNLGDEYFDMKDWQKAVFSYRKAANFLESKRGPDDLEVAKILTKLAKTYFNWKGHHILSESLFQRVLAIREKVLGPNHPDVADSLDNLGAVVYFPGGRLAQAEPMFGRALAIREEKLGPDHPKVANSLNKFAFIRDFQGKFEEAEQLYSRALYILEKNFGPNSPEVAGPLHSLITIYGLQRKFDKADSVWQRYLSNLQTRLGQDHPETISEMDHFSKRWWKTESIE